jgi:serine/threonine-protein kinase MRCK
VQVLGARPRIRRADFVDVKRIAQGRTADLWLATHRVAASVPFVIKVIDKERLLIDRSPANLLNERDVMVIANQARQQQHQQCHAASNTMVGFDSLGLLRYAFHDDTNVYLVTDFYGGGDFCNLLDKFERFGEDRVRAYGAQLVVALEALHSLGFVRLFCSSLSSSSLVFCV